MSNFEPVHFYQNEGFFEAQSIFEQIHSVYKDALVYGAFAGRIDKGGLWCPEEDSSESSLHSTFSISAFDSVPVHCETNGEIYHMKRIAY